MTSVTLGNATLHQADCTEVLDLIPECDLLLTDPPYGIGFAAQPTKWQRRAGQEAQEWDDAPAPSLEAIRFKGRSQIIWGGNYYTLPPSRGWLCWFKPDAPPSMSQLELAWTNMDRNALQLTQSIGATNAERVGHPTQKPVRLMTWCLSLVPDAQSVFDPFMGSGSTGVACAQMGVSFYGVELKHEYFELACARIDQAQRQQRLFP